MKRRLAAPAALLALLGLIGLVVIGRELYRPYRGYSVNQLVEVEPGWKAPAVAELLVERGVLAHRWPFLVSYWVGRSRHRLKAGEYLFDHPLRPVDVYRKLVHGDVYLHAVVIPEGSDQLDIARILLQQLGMKPEEFLRVVRESDAVLEFDPAAPTLEGYLFPDTYRFPRGVSAASAAATMVARFRQVVEARLGAELRQSSLSLHDVITLASLVEKETPDPHERPIVAGVFERRLKKGWPLECDPTVVYATRVSHHLIERPAAPISQSELMFDSPYNTYRHAGLPPGPISNPGVASIRAALHPTDDKFLYFVSNNHGGHVFARTLAEHQRNVARYRRQVAALHRAALEGAAPAEQAPAKEQRGGDRGAKNSAQSAKHKKQKTTHPRLQPGAGARMRGDEGNTGHRS